MADNKKIAIIDGHPDRREDIFCHALAGAYTTAALSAGHRVRRITLAHVEVPLLTGKKEWEHGELPSSLREAQEAIDWADHLLIIYPLWLGTMPALLKAFFEQVLRPGFAISAGARGLNSGLLGGKSARVVVTMATPVIFYRLYFLAHGVSALKRNILQFVGIKPVVTTLIGGIETMDVQSRQRWMRRIERLGKAGK